MNRREHYRTIAINILLSIVISMVLNFSYLVFLMVGPHREPAPKEPQPQATEQVVEAVKDEEVSEQMVPELNSAQTDSLKREVIIREENIIRQHSRRGNDDAISDTTRNIFIALDLLFYFVASLLMLTIMTRSLSARKRNHFVRRLAFCLVLLLPIYLLAPQLTWRGEIVITANTHYPINPMTILKLVTTFIVAAFYGKIYELLYAKQAIEMENEKLKNENLTWQYNTLVNQVNPHFLFNSLNSLSMLVREHKSEDALTYIGRMSDTYRYIIEEGKVERTTVASELSFLDAYRYMLEVRYAGKLHIELNVDSDYDDYELPPLSIQPLIENAVKHNTITSSKPLTISIRGEEDYIVVSNPIQPKLQSEESTGIGLANLSSRYELIVDRKVEVSNDGKEFRVRLPLIHPSR